MTKSELALNAFKEGCNCSQSILAVYGAGLGLDAATALKISCAFGGGMGRMGETCGAVTGALMALGLKYGSTESKDLLAKMKTYQLAKEFADKFKSRNGTISCKELLGCDLSTEEGLTFAVKNKLFETRCPKFVEDAAEILEQLL